MFSRFIRIVAAWIRTSFVFMTNNYSTVWRAHIMSVHSFINEWTCTLNLFFFIEFEKESCMHLSAGPTPTWIQLGWQTYPHLILVTRLVNGRQTKRLAERTKAWEPCLYPASTTIRASQVVLVVKNLPVNAGDVRDIDLISGSGRSPAGGYSNPLQYFCLEILMDRRSWWTTGHGITKSQTQMSD